MELMVFGDHRQHRNKGVCSHSQGCVLPRHIQQARGGRGRGFSYYGDHVFESESPMDIWRKRASRFKGLSLDGAGVCVGYSMGAMGFGLQ